MSDLREQIARAISDTFAPLLGQNPDGPAHVDWEAADRILTLLSAAPTGVHWRCDCVPDLGPAHCHLCDEQGKGPIAWADAHPAAPVNEHEHVRDVNERELRTVTSVEELEELEALPPNTALLIHGGQNLAFAWELDPDADLPATVLTPATTREVGAEQAWDECVAVIEAKFFSGPTKDMVLGWLTNPYRAASAKGDGK